MLYSKSKNLIFIHVYKNAGCSIKDALKIYDDTYNNRRFLGKIFTKIGIKLNLAPPAHISASDAKKLLGEKVWDNAYTFAVVRNPWDWQVSLYSFMLKIKGHHQHELISKMKSFDEYISWRCEEDFHSQSEYLTDTSGDNIIVKDVYKLESINSDIQRLRSAIGCDIRLKKLNQSRDDSYKKYYSDRSREMVRKYFKEDIDRFGYEF